jgi:calcineurin-like phosphoesterase family protein
MKYLFSSDYHFWHKNILLYENRPFKSVEEMNSTIISRHNERANNDDIVFFLGDLGFFASANKVERGEGMPNKALDLLKQMNGHTIYRIKGNHDKRSNKLYVPVKSINLDISGLKIQLVHRPDDADIDNNNLIIHGHCHSKLPTHEKLNSKKIPVYFINVSVECNNYYPFTWDELKAMWDKWLQNHKQRKVVQKCLTQSQKSK